MGSVFLADTSAITRVMVVKSLEEDGHRVEETSDGRQVLDMCTTAPPDCLIMDLVLQNLDGFKILRALREQEAPFPVLVMTDLKMHNLEQQCLELGAKAFFRKPVPPLKLREKVNELVRAYRGEGPGILGKGEEEQAE